MKYVDFLPGHNGYYVFTMQSALDMPRNNGWLPCRPFSGDTIDVGSDKHGGYKETVPLELLTKTSGLIGPDCAVRYVLIRTGHEKFFSAMEHDIEPIKHGTSPMALKIAGGVVHHPNGRVASKDDLRAMIVGQSIRVKFADGFIRTITCGKEGFGVHIDRTDLVAHQQSRALAAELRAFDESLVATPAPQKATVPVEAPAPAKKAKKAKKAVALKPKPSEPSMPKPGKSTVVLHGFGDLAAAMHLEDSSQQVAA
jgi:hypothetical protein